MHGAYKTEGIILKRMSFGEADKILTIYTKHYGKIRAVAKGIRKIKSRKGGNVELFNQSIVFLIRGRNLDILTEAQVINSFKAWRHNLEMVVLAYYFCELVDKLTPDGQANGYLYDILRSFLGKIGQEGYLGGLARSFEEKVLIELGFGIPQALRGKEESLKSYIEEVSERKLNSQTIFH